MNPNTNDIPYSCNDTSAECHSSSHDTLSLDNTNIPITDNQYKIFGDGGDREDISEDGELEVTQTEDQLPTIEGSHIHLTAELLAQQNEMFEKDADHPPLPKPSAIRAWAADLPEAPDFVKPIVTTSHVFEVPLNTPDTDAKPSIQETKDIFSETQKIAYVGLCYLASLEVVHDLQGKEFAYARMSADNWQRKWMKTIFTHMDITKEEMKMIESLSKHNIMAVDLVHQFTSQGSTTEIKLNELNKRNSVNKGTGQSVDNKIIIDLCWTVMCDLFLISLSTENYDARSRVFISRIASYLSLDWFQVIGFERRIAEHLLQDSAWETETVTSMNTSVTIAHSELDGSVKNHTERKGRNRQRKKKRYVMIGLATIGGGLILGLSAGLMAPVIAGGLGVVLSAVGVTGSAGFLGGTAGIALITSSATVAGGRIGGKGMSKRMKSISTFDFIPVYVDESPSCIVTISGWLPSVEQEEASAPFSMLDSLMGDHYSLYWEPEMLSALGSAFRIFATEAITFSVQQALAHTIMGALLSGLAFPLAMTKLGYMVDNPWANGLDRSKVAGLILADALMNRNLGARPVTLIGYSLGARVIFYCLLELARIKAYGLVENVALFGTPVSASHHQWKECTTVVSGRFVNGYATNDWLLGFLFRTSTAGLGNIAGLRPLLDVEGDRVHNLDCTDLITGHLSYRAYMPKLLKRAGFLVTSDELLVSKDKEKDSNIYTVMNFMKKNDSKSQLEDRTINPEPSISNSSNQRSLTSFSSRGNSDNSDSCPNKLNEVSPRHTLSSPRTSILREAESSRPSNDKSDYEIIADIIASATAAASMRSSNYSSLSSGKASITSDKNSVQTSRSNSTRRSTLNSFFGASNRSETTASMPPTPTESTRRSSMFSTPFFSKKRVEEDPNRKELIESGVQVKELKSTLGRMVIPKEVSHPMPIVKLEMPKSARLNR
ncbi:hypothetical protein BDB01DRAFT_811552 [Pilobolus umbonatus]|nr:hypothetical protein BDB01DRAFT_811552 [Pilobolus umbonatus]